LREYQESAVQALIDYEQGIYEAMTGAGKTLVALEAIRRADQPTLIVVDRSALAEQWRTAIRESLGVESGYVGDSSVDVRPITVCLRQALWARYDEFDQPRWNLLDLVEGTFWDLWGVLISDEVHHCPAETMQDLMQRFPARYRWGLSATPRRDEALWPITQAIIGPVVHRSAREDLDLVVVTPRVEVLDSDFEFDYRPTMMVDELDPHTHESVISRSTGRPVQIRLQNNWGEMLKELCRDQRRNTMIAERIIELVGEGRRVLVVSRRKTQLAAIQRLLDGIPEPVLVLVGGDKASRVEQAKDVVSAGPCVLLSTVAEEGFDAPALDAVVVPYPVRNTEILVQIVGRVMRSHVDKKDAIVVDVRDRGVGLLASQARDRLMYYKSSGYEVSEPILAK
jgi:superfamily II DNA or RNA helicase